MCVCVCVCVCVGVCVSGVCVCVFFEHCKGEDGKKRVGWRKVTFLCGLIISLFTSLFVYDLHIFTIPNYLITFIYVLQNGFF